MIIARTGDRTQLDNPTEASLVKFEPDTVAVVNYESSEKTYSYVATDGSKAARWLKSKAQRKWQIQLSYEYAGYCEQFKDILTYFQCMWDNHLKKVKISKRQIELTAKITQNLHSTSCPPKHKVRHFEKIESYKT